MAFQKQTSTTGPINLTGSSSTEIQLASSSPIKEAVFVHQIDITNSSAANANVGFGFKLLSTEYKVGAWSNTNVYTDDTTDAQSSTAADVALFVVNTNSAGFVVQAQQPFNLISINTNAAPAGGSPVYSYTYWNGTGWANCVLLETPSYSANTLTNIGFFAPLDMTPLTSSDSVVVNSGLSAGYYAVKVVASTAPTSAGGTAQKIGAIKLLDFAEDVPAGATAYRAYAGGMFIPHQRPVVPFTSPYDANNSCSIEYHKSA